MALERAAMNGLVTKLGGVKPVWDDSVVELSEDNISIIS